MILFSISNISGKSRKGVRTMKSHNAQFSNKQMKAIAIKLVDLLDY